MNYYRTAHENVSLGDLCGSFPTLQIIYILEDKEQISDCCVRREEQGEETRDLSAVNGSRKSLS